MDTTGTAVAETVASPTAEQLMGQVRRATRKRLSAEEKIRIVIEGMKRETPVSDLCRREGISSALYYNWLKDFMEAGKARLKGDALRQANTAEVVALRKEVSQLKETLGEHTLRLTLLKKSLRGTGEAGIAV